MVGVDGMLKKKQLPIGTVVRCSAIVKKIRRDGRVAVFVESTDPFLALVTGATVKYAGSIESPDNGEYYDPYFHITGSVKVCCVRTGLNRKELHVPFDYLEVVERAECPDWFGTSTPVDPELSKVSFMYARVWPRDSKGRFKRSDLFTDDEWSRVCNVERESWES